MIIGDASINDRATLSGTFFFINLLETGITAQSHAGKKNPNKTPTSEPVIIFFGISEAILSLDIYLSIIADNIDPSNKNGNASKNIDIKIIDMFLIISMYNPLT